MTGFFGVINKRLKMVAQENIPAIEATSLVRRFGSVVALDNVSIDIRAGEFFSLLGPSGCGKTTLLRIVAGLDSPDTGSLKICGQDVAAIPPHKRPVNTVFQSYALFPHMTVWDNVAFGLRMKNIPRAQIKERVDRTMSLVQITELAARFPSQISGGQKQRVALARALVNEPKVLLLDEPLGALDLKLRKELQIELHHLQRRVGTTFIHVTHDQDEALTMSHRIAVMNAGRIEQLGDARNLYEQPRTRFVAQFLGTCNLIEGNICGFGGEITAIGTQFTERQLDIKKPKHNFTNGDSVTLAIRPEKILLRSEKADLPNQFRVAVEDSIYSGAETQYRLRSGGQTLNAVAFNSNTSDHSWKIGSELYAQLPPDALILLDD